MSGGNIATIIGALTGLFGASYATWVKARSDKEKTKADNIKSNTDHAAILLGGWENFQANTLKEVERVRKTCQEEIAALKADREADRAEYEADRAEWQKRDSAKQDEIDKLKSQVLILEEKNTRREQ